MHGLAASSRQAEVEVQSTGCEALGIICNGTDAPLDEALMPHICVVAPNESELTFISGVPTTDADGDERRQRQRQRRTTSDGRGMTNDTRRTRTEDEGDDDIDGDDERRQRRRR